MEVFVWNMAISFQLLFIIISSVIFIYLREKSFKFYVLYNICLVIYVLSRSDDNYYTAEHFIAQFTGKENSEIIFSIFCFFIQIVFYVFYSIFALYFLDLDKKIRKYFNAVLLVLKILTAFFFVLGIGSYLFKNIDLYINAYIFIFLPVMLTIFILSVTRAIKYSGKHKDFFLIGVCAYVFCALVAFAGSFIPSLNMDNPISYFFIGIILETIFFSLGLAYKVKIINDEKNRVRNLVTKHKHQQQISKLKGLLEGEEKERKRIAEELHDGIAGDLSAIKFNLAFLNQENNNGKHLGILNDLNQTIDKSCVQIREISHNLSPSSITNYGLIKTVENFCKKIEDIYSIKVNFTSSGERIEVGNASEIHIYRIIQELVNNIVKHSEATLAHVEILNQYPTIILFVKDNGKGFLVNNVSKGIGLSNIDSRIRFLEADFKRESSQNGTSYKISINAQRIHKD